jgi:hypothetical protein
VPEFWSIASILSHLVRGPRSAHLDTVAPFTNQVTIVMIVINGLFLAVLILSGIWLLRLRTNAVRMCNILFSAEVVYFIGVVFLWANFLGFPEKVVRSIAAASGVGNIGIGWQLVIGYPVLSLVVLNIVRSKLGRVPA